MSAIKTFLKAVVAGVREAGGRLTFRVYGLVASLLPRGFVLFVKQNHKIVVPLQEAGDDLRLRVECRGDVNRARQIAKEPGTKAWVKEHIKNGAVLYDVGANVGVFSLLAARNAPDVKIYAFEPSFTTYPLLMLNILENNCQGRIKPFMLPLSDRTAKTPFNYRTLEPGDSRHCVGEKVDYYRGLTFDAVLETEVLSYSIDDLVFNYGFDAPTHLKLDVDSIEYDILVGARGVLQKGSVRSIIVEFCKNNPKSGLIEGFLTEMGYRLKEKHYHVYQAGKKTYSADNFYDCVFER